MKPSQFCLMLITALLIFPLHAVAEEDSPAKAFTAYVDAMKSHDVAKVKSTVDLSNKANLPFVEFSEVYISLMKQQDALAEALIKKYGKEANPVGRLNLRVTPSFSREMNPGNFLFKISEDGQSAATHTIGEEPDQQSFHLIKTEDGWKLNPAAMPMAQGLPMVSKIMAALRDADPELKKAIEGNEKFIGFAQAYQLITRHAVNKARKEIEDSQKEKEKEKADEKE